MGSPYQGMNPRVYGISTINSHVIGENPDGTKKIDPTFGKALMQEIKWANEQNGWTGKISDMQFAQAVNRANSLSATTYYEDVKQQEQKQQEQQQKQEEKKNTPSDVPGTVDPVPEQKTPTGDQKNKPTTDVNLNGQNSSGIAGSILHVKGGGGQSETSGGGVLDPTTTKKDKNKTLG